MPVAHQLSLFPGREGALLQTSVGVETHMHRLSPLLYLV